MRVLIKISGEAIMGKEPFGIEGEGVRALAKRLSSLSQKGHQVGIVIGGGNFFRGLKQSEALLLERTAADSIGMLATMMNGIALKQALLKEGRAVTLMSALECPTIAERFHSETAHAKLERGEILLFVGGTGHPYFTTDTAAALRALEIKAEILLKATTKVDGIYSADPLKDKSATKYEKLSYKEFIEKRLEAMDSSAVALCMANRLPIRLFNLLKTDLETALEGRVGTLIS